MTEHDEQPLRWPDPSADIVVAEDDDGARTMLLLDELQAGGQAAVRNLQRPIDAGARKRYESIARAFLLAERSVIELWRQAHPDAPVPTGLQSREAKLLTSTPTN